MFFFLEHSALEIQVPRWKVNFRYSAPERLFFLIAFPSHQRAICDV